MAAGRALSASQVCPLPCQILGGSPRALAGLASEGRGTGHSGRPQPRVGGVRTSSLVPGPGLRQRQGERAGTGGPTGAPCLPGPGLTRALGLRGQEGEGVLCGCGREGKGESGQTEGRSGGLPFGPAHTTVTGHGGGWRHTLTATSTDRQTCTLRPPRGLGQPARRGPEPAAAHLPSVAPHPPSG